jgi:ATP-dependent DNA helicase RecG
VAATPFATAIDAIRRPLSFAAQDGFARADRLRNLETSVAGAARRAASLAIPPDARLILEKIAQRFESPLEGEARIAAVGEALDLLRPLGEPAWAEQALARPVDRLPGVGPRRAEALVKRGLRSVSDLLLRLPSRYDDRRTFALIGQLEVGSRATFVAEVLSADFVARRGRGRRLFQALVGDPTGTVTLKWFRGGEALRSSLRKGRRIRVTGDVRRYRFAREIIHPEIDLLGEEEDSATDPRVVPDYAAPEGIPPRTFRRTIAAAVTHYVDLVPSYLPEALVRERRLPETAAALRWIHDPGDDVDLRALRERETPAHQRLVLEELYLLEVGLALRRAKRAREPGIAIDVARARIDAAEAALPFRLTRAQARAWAEIRADLGRPHPMSRLLQGDVGSGKTAVAFLAAVAAAESGFQTALMAPTELLAEQHERTLRELAAGGGEATRIRLALLTASVSRAAAEEIRSRTSRGEVDLVVGTHALVQGDVEFARLALAVVDEQHRFGVLQRAALAKKSHAGLSPHALVMTATPIPRSLAMTVYGDLDLSVIDELPPGRRPPETVLLRAGEGQRVTELIRETVARGEQVYVVYPLVEESEKIDLRAAVESTERIRAAFPELRVDLVHGRLDSKVRAEAMAGFVEGSTQILVSTTVIEVGVDVPNATLMVVEHAERFGLAQLHQLRGRVGRRDRLGTCALVARAASEESEARLRAMLETCDGFRIADADLRIRGPGEFLGTRQHGRLPDLRIADLIRDTRLVSVAREAALATVRRDPDLRRAPDLARAVELRWGGRLALAEVG